MEYVIAIGFIAVVFGTLLLFAPNSILSLERRANPYLHDGPNIHAVSCSIRDRSILGSSIHHLLIDE